MPKPPRPSSDEHEPPLIGRIVHGLVIATGVIGAAWYGWTLGSSTAMKSALALVGGALFAVLWLSIYSPVDPERRSLGILPVSGRTLIVLEVALIVAGGTALWLAWHRAAGETYWTVAFIDLAVRYSRFSALWRSNPASSDRERSQ